MRNHDTSFLTAPAIQMTRAGIKRIAVSDETTSKGALPFTLDMVLKYGQAAQSSGSLESLGVYTAMYLAFSCLLRRSEYIPTEADHYLRARDVSFVLNDGSKVGSHDLSLQHVPLIVEIVVYIRSSKRDQDCNGLTFAFARSHAAMKEICNVLINWAIAVHCLPDDPFLSARNLSGKQVWCINAAPLQSAMQAIARSLGFSADQVKRFTPHSLRYGGASTLAAAGVDRYQIQLAGRWKSDTFMTYLLAFHAMFERTHFALANPSWLTALSIKRISA